MSKSSVNNQQLEFCRQILGRASTTNYFTSDQRVLSSVPSPTQLPFLREAAHVT